ncbi:flagellar hook-length control protein FliK [Alteromonas antoniana]|uniref:flagellar hook-length control protein FliK n=1 Tax=Alteromonas antoniana TaxID=2803813 RepID=UPI001C4524C4|nr:flagellar hook-length control protein FliK [Alteromonas antoniana]
MNFQLPDVSGLPASLQSASQNAPDKLLQAATLSTLAKVAIARLPEQILRISVPGAEKKVELDLRLPSSTLLKDNAPTFIARTPGKDASTAVLMQALEQRNQQPLSTKAEAALTQYITRLMQAQPHTTMTIQARVVSATENSLSLSVDNRKNQPVISLPVKSSQSVLKPNDPVSVSLKPLPKGGFEVAITPKSTSQGTPAPLTTSTIKAGSDAANALINAKLSQTGVTLKQTASVPVPKPLERHIPAMSSRSMPSAPPFEQMLFVKVERSVAGMPELQTRQVALQAVAKASIPPDINQQARIPVLARNSALASIIAAVPEARVQPSMFQPGTSVTTPGQAQPTVPVEPKPGAESTALNLTGKAKLTLPPQEQEKVHAQIIELSRALLKDTGSTKEALSQLIQILKTGNVNTGAQTKQTISQVLAAIQGTDPKPFKLDTGLATETGIPAEANKSQPSTLSQQIQSLMTTPALNLTPVQLTTPAPANNLVAGLVLLLQLTLAGRAINRQPALAAQADAPEQLLQKVVPQTSGPTSAPSRVSQDLASLESRSQFLSQVKTLLANHQQQKLSQADSRLQGQDSLYYVLPVTSQKGAPPEILIRADERGSRQAESSDSKRKLWNVTMKLDVGDFGELLAKSRIDGDVIELDLYTSTDALLQRVADTLPLLKRRLTALGLEVAQSSFQRGKIPSTLQDRPYHIFETQA